jgi:ATP-dependent DNA ligase
MAKRRDSTYSPGKRSESWLKIKTRQTTECVIVGYTEGKGDRVGAFGALHLAQERGGELKYVGKVGTGFDEPMLKAVWKELISLTRIKRPVKEAPLESARSTWVEPRLVCEVRFASLTPEGRLREPVFVRLRPDLSLNRMNSADRR